MARILDFAASHPILSVAIVFIVGVMLVAGWSDLDRRHGETQ
jgi:hypothetical protein